MQVIHCTSKLQKEMGLKKADLCEVSPKFSYLGSWHANLLYIDRRKCILFANDKTLFNFIATDVSRAQIRDLGDLFKGLLRCVLSDEDFIESVQEKILFEYHELGFAGLYFSGDEAEESIDSLAVELHPLAYNMKCTEVAIFVELGRIRNSVSILLSI
jgi:hypothetical protein